MVLSPCSKVKNLQDFGIKLGSLNDTDANLGESIDQEETDDIIHRGPYETVYNEWRPMYFRIPYESYLIPGSKLGRDENICYLSITGYIPDQERAIVLG